MTYWARSFAGLPEYVAEVRECIRKVLGECEGVDLVELVATELASNAIRHSGSGEPGGKFTVHLAEFVDRWRVRVDDAGGSSVPHLCAALVIESAEDLDQVDVEAEAGRGLELVAAVSSAWGVLGDTFARAVWADVLIPGSTRRRSLSEPIAAAWEENAQ
ncbi:ATP-binding protein [Catenulispora pinisilvae]|uniref:ATP-binding protein n=1 Tax=Catenulispora pinisilvae TaxID=2705253 RepID=UPI00189193D8|nr:ATP-binding protein [Catenulispora pinisilvae]